MAEVEIAGAKIKGGRLMLLVPIVSALGGGLWGGFEFYKDYMDMKEIVQNIDVDAIEARNTQIVQKLDDAIEYTRDIKSGLRDDILSIEKQADRVEDKARNMEEKVRDMIDKASERFETRRDSLIKDNNRELKDLEKRLTDKIQKALDNPLADST